MKIPATVITGFLGAGKTTLIRHLLENANGRRIALIINEFGDLGIDREIVSGCAIEGCNEEDVMELANGCICCTVADEFLPVMEALLARDVPPEHIVIETSGLALPKPLIKAFNWPEVKTRVTVDGVIAVVDAPALHEGTFAHDPAAVQESREADENLNHETPLSEVFEDQLLAADLVVLGKADLLDEAQMQALSARLAGELREGVRVLSTEQGRVPVDVLLGLGAGAEDDLDARPSHHDLDDDHEHDDFESFTIDIETIHDPKHLEATLIEVARDHGVLRMKGFVEVAEKPMRHVVQGVGLRFTRYFDRPWKETEARDGRLVVIGEAGLDRVAITQKIQGATGSNASKSTRESAA